MRTEPIESNLVVFKPSPIYQSECIYLHSLMLLPEVHSNLTQLLKNNASSEELITFLRTSYSQFIGNIENIPNELFEEFEKFISKAEGLVLVDKNSGEVYTIKKTYAPETIDREDYEGPLNNSKIIKYDPQKVADIVSYVNTKNENNFLSETLEIDLLVSRPQGILTDSDRFRLRVLNSETREQAIEELFSIKNVKFKKATRSLLDSLLEFHIDNEVSRYGKIPEKVSKFKIDHTIPLNTLTHGINTKVDTLRVHTQAVTTKIECEILEQINKMVEKDPYNETPCDFYLVEHRHYLHVVSKKDHDCILKSQIFKAYPVHSRGLCLNIKPPNIRIFFEERTNSLKIEAEFVSVFRRVNYG